MGISIPTLPISKKYTADTADKMGAVKGLNAQLASIEPNVERSGKIGSVVTYAWYDGSDVRQTTTDFIPYGKDGKDGAQGAQGAPGKDGKDGVSVVSITIPDPDKAEIVVNYSDGTHSSPIPIPTVKGDPGEDGVSPSIEVHTDTSTEYTLDITDASGTITTPNLKGSSDAKTKKVITANIDVGGISKDTEFPIGTNYDTMWESLLDKTFYPTFSDPSASLTYSADAYVAVGGTISAKTATLVYNAGSITLNGEKQADRGGVATGFAIATTGADTEYSDSSENSGSFNVPALVRSTKGTIKLTGTVSYAQGAQPKDSKGADYDDPLPAGSVTAEKTVTFIQPFYYGVSNSSTVADFTGFTANVTPKGNKTFSYTTSNQYMVIAYDSSYGNLKNIIDPNGFETISGWTKSTLTVGGFSYFVYVANSPTTDTNAAFTFKF